MATPNSNMQKELEPGPKNINNAKMVSQPESLGAVDDNLEKKTPQPTNTGKRLMEQPTDHNGQPVSSVPTSSVDKTTPVISNPRPKHVRRSKKLQLGVSTESQAADTPSQAQTENLSALATEARMNLSTRIRKPVVPFKFESFTEKKVVSYTASLNLCL